MGAPSSWVATGTTGLTQDHETPIGTTFRLTVTTTLALVSRLWQLPNIITLCCFYGQQAGANQVPAIKSSFGELRAEW